MFCKKCGSEINDGAAFCPKCGTSLRSADQSAARQRNNPASPVMPISEINMGNTTQGTSGKPDRKLEGVVNAAVEGLGRAAEKEKDFLGKTGGSNSDGRSIKKGWLIAGIVAAASLLLLVVNGARINNFVHRTFSSPEKYYQFIEKKTVNEMSGYVGEWYDRYFLDALNFYDKSIETDLTVELEKDGQEFLGLLGLAGVDISWFESIAVGADASVKDDAASAGLSFTLNGSDIMSYNMIADMGKETVYFQFPELNKTYLGVDISEEISDSYNMGMMISGNDYDGTGNLIEEFQRMNKELLQACPSQSEMEKLTKRYMILALECVNDVSKSREVLKVEGIEQKCTVLEVTVDSDTLRDMYQAVLEEMRDDKEIKSLMENLIQTGSEAISEGVDTEEIYEEFQDEIDDMLDNLDYFYFGSGEIVMKVYVDGKGEIRGRSIDLGYVTVSSLMPEKGNKFGYELSGNMYGTTMKLTGSGKISSNKISGDFQIKYNGASLVDITTKELNIEDLKAGRLNGAIEVKASSKIGTVIGSVPGLSIIEDMQINMDFESSKNKSSYKIGFVYDEQNIGSVAVSLKTGDGSKVTIPSGKSVTMVENVDDVEEWFEDIELGDLIMSLKKADVPYQITDVLEKMDDADDIYDTLDVLERSLYYMY